MIAVGYARVSTDKQQTESQVDEVQRFASSRGLDLSKYGVLVEEDRTETRADGTVRVKGVSAFKRRLEDRPQGKILVRLVEANEVQAVIVYKHDRLFRRASEALRWAEALADAGIRLYAVDESAEVDVQTVTGLITYGVKSLFAQIEPMNARDRTLSTFRHMKSRHKRTGNIPYGWRLAGDTKLLVEEPGEQLALDRMRLAAALGSGPAAIARELASDGVPGPRGNGWNRKTVWRILHGMDRTGSAWPGSVCRKGVDWLGS